MAGLRDSVVLVTGASSGIGAGIAVCLAAEGCKVALVGRNAERLNETAQKCMQKGLAKDQVLIIQADLCNEEDVKRIVQTTLKMFGKLNVLVNDAAIALHNSILSDHLMSDFDLVVKNNVRSTVQLTHLAVPHLIASQGCIVNILSINGVRAVGPGLLTTSITKASLEQFTKVLALELGPKGVRVNAVHPGCIMTPILTGLNDDQSEDDIRESLKHLHPLGRVGEVEEVASVVRFLVSPEASFVNGSSVCCDGGCHAMSPR